MSYVNKTKLKLIKDIENANQNRHLVLFISPRTSRLEKVPFTIVIIKNGMLKDKGHLIKIIKEKIRIL